MSLINYLGTFDTLTAIWEAYPEGGKEGDYIIIGGEYYQWDKYSASWSLSAQIPNEAIVAEEDYFTPMRNGSDVIGDTSEQTNVFINFLGHFASLTEVWGVYPEGGKEGDYIIISEQRLWWNKYAQEWDNAIIASSDITDVEIDITLPSSCVNPLGRFDSLADAWRKHPEGGREGDYIQIAEDIYKWDKYLTAWINIKELPSSELMPIVPTFTEDVVEYSDGYINYIGTFDTLEQVWLVYPEGGKEGDYIIVDGERYRWNKLTNNWGEVDPDAETPARPVVSIFGDLHIHNDTVIGEKLYAEILKTFTTKRWVLEQGYIGNEDITPTLIMSNIVPDNVTIGIKDGKLVVIGGGTADSISWEDITNKPSWLEGEEGFVTISSEQTIRAHKNFEKGISVQGAPISYDAVKKVWIFDANMLVTGGLAWNSSLDGFKPETITDAVMIDDSTLGRKENGEIYVKGGAGGGGSIKYPLSWSGYSSGMYDGSAPANIAIPSLLSQLTNDSDYITTASVNSLLTDYLPKSGGVVSGDITADTVIAKSGVDVLYYYLGGNDMSAADTTTHGTTLGYGSGDSFFWFFDTKFFSSLSATANRVQMAYGYERDRIKYRRYSGGWGDWKEVAFTDSKVASATNADSATVLGYNSPFVQDFNALNYSNNGLYHFDGNYLNLIGGPPHNAWNYSVLNMGSGSGRRQQVAIPYSTSRMFLRVNVDDNWSGWREFAFVDTDSLTPSSGILTVNGNFLATGGLTAQNSSDRRLKENIRDFDAISILRGMGGVHAYEYVDTEVARDARYAGTHYGFIYQDVEGSKLERMCLKRDDGYGTLNYLDSNLISVVAGGVLSLDDRVKLLEEEINRLKTSLS